MDRREVKKYLEKIIELDMEIDDKIAEMEAYRTLAEKITKQFSLDPVQASGKKDKIAELAVKIADTENEINDKIDKLFDMKKERAGKIKLLNDQRERKVLIKRYVCGIRYQKIADSMNIDISYVFKLEKRALEHMIQILENK